VADVSRPEVCVIFNPASGRGRSGRRLNRLLHAWRGKAEFRPTAAAGQAEELARQAALDGFATVAAAGGDGTVHEVANGLLGSGRPDVTLAVLPAGSANDYAFALGLDPGWWRRPDPGVAVRRVDVGLVRADGRSRYFVNGLGLGFNALVTLESRRIRRLQGVALYGLALLRVIRSHSTPPRMEVRLDEAVRVGPTLALALALGRREGNFVVAPEAVLDDGLFDGVLAGPLTRREMACLLPRLALGRGLPRDHPNLWLTRCRAAAVRSEAALAVHVDGELFCVPADGVHALDVGLLPGALRVLGKDRPRGGRGNPVKVR
jgi:diacylglycerol kinase family enzyme